MVARDPHRFVNELDEAALERLIARLETRAQDAVFARLLDKYSVELPRSPTARILEVGCGTGAVLRRLARHGEFKGTAIGVDHCRQFIEAASILSLTENTTGQLAFQVGDAHQLIFPTATFDAVIAHTLMSHVTSPEAVLREMARVVRPGGMVVIFDGDYASMTYACPDHDLGNQMDRALVDASFNNPRIMRELPRLLPRFGLRLMSAWGDAVVEIGSASYFKSFAQTYVPYVTKAGLLPVETVEAWLSAQQRAMEDGTFFAACNYYAYLASRITPNGFEPNAQHAPG